MDGVQTKAFRAIALGGVAALLVVGVVAYEVGYARAAGVPTPNTLSYTGTLLTFGAPDNATHNMSVALFIGGVQQCTTSTASVTCVNGQFTIPLTSCLSVFQINPNVDAQVTIDGTAMGQVAITAVPYAVVAQNATGALTPQSVSIDGGYPQLTSAGVVLSAASGATVTAAPWQTLTGGTTSVADSLHTHAGLTHAWISIGNLSQIFRFRGLGETGATVGVGGVTYPPLQYEYGATYNNPDPIPIVLSGWDGGFRAMFVYPYMTGDGSFQPGGWFGTTGTAFNENCGKTSLGDTLWYDHYWYGFEYTSFTSGNGCTGGDPGLFVRLR